MNTVGKQINTLSKPFAKTSYLPRLLLALGLLPLSATSFSSDGTNAGTNAERDGLEEVLVTTQHRQVSSQNLAISSSIKSSADIEQLDLHGNGSLADVTPGLSHAEFASGQSYLAMRGILSIDDGPGMDNSVVVFLDGVYIGRLSNVDFDLLDIQRIEVLRGPQGTLFGRNAIGGAINIITQQPTQEFDVSAKVGIGNYDIHRYSAVVNGALSNPLHSGSLSGRLSISHREHGGYTRNILLNEDNQTEDKTNLRGQLRYRHDTQQWTLSYDYAEDARADMGRFPVEESGLGSLAQWRALGGTTGKSTAPINGFSERTAHGLHLLGQSEFSSGRLHTIIATRQSKSNWAMASTGAPIAISPPFPALDLANGRFGSDVNDVIDEEIDQQSIELRWVTDLGTSLHLSSGFFALSEHSKRSEQYQLVENSVTDGQVLVGNEITQQDNTTESVALYSQLQWQINARLKSILGARWTQDKKRIQSLGLNCGEANPLTVSSPFCSVNSGAFLNIIRNVFEAEASEAWTDISPKFSLQYTPIKHVMSYASITKGFKSGGFPGSPGSVQIAVTPVAPEKAWNYEVGIKSEWLDRRLRLNTSAFNTDYENLQIVRFGPTPENPNFGSFITTNIGSADISGIEIESQWLLSEDLRLIFNYAYLESKINDLMIETTRGAVDASGSELRQAPQNSYHFSADYRLPTPRAWGELNALVDYQYADEQLSDYINRDTRIDELSQTNARLTWTHKNERVQLALWVKNIEGTRRIAHAYTVAGGVFGVWSAPRTFGLTLSWNRD